MPDNFDDDFSSVDQPHEDSYGASDYTGNEVSTEESAVVNNTEKEQKLALEEAINQAISTPFETGVPKNKLKSFSAENIPTLPILSKVLSLLKYLSVFAGAFFLTYYFMSTAYDQKRIAKTPLASYNLEMSASAIKSRQMLYKGIGNARKSLTIILPIQYGLDPDIYKILYQKASQGLQIVLILSTVDPNYNTVRRYLEYYTQNKAIIAGVGSMLYSTTILVDGAYTMETAAPINSNFGKMPMHGNFTIYRDPNRVKEKQHEITMLQKAYKQ